jgi:hypothetical protein
MNNLSIGNIRVHIADIVCDAEYSYKLENNIKVNIDSVFFQREVDEVLYELDTSVGSSFMRDQSFYNYLISAIKAKENI